MPDSRDPELGSKGPELTSRDLALESKDPVIQSCDLWMEFMGSLSELGGPELDSASLLLCSVSDELKFWGQVLYSSGPVSICQSCGTF